MDKIKTKVTNPYLKDNLTVENIANFFANFISGNSFVNNLEVKDIAEFNKVEIKENIKVKGDSSFEKITFNKLKNKAMTITDNEIIFDPDASIKLRNNKISFKIKDIFEVITFMKYIVKICGSKLEKCDFNNLLKNHNANHIMQLIKTFQQKIDDTQKKTIELQEIKLKEELKKRDLEEKKRQEINLKKKEMEKKKEEEKEKQRKEKELKEKEKKEKEKKEKEKEKENEKEKKEKEKREKEKKKNINLNANANNLNVINSPYIEASEIGNLRGSLYGLNNINKDMSAKHFTFKEKDFNDIEKQINSDLLYKPQENSFEDYSKFLENPQISDMMTNYYYSMPNQNGFGGLEGLNVAGY